MNLPDFLIKENRQPVVDNGHDINQTQKIVD